VAVHKEKSRYRARTNECADGVCVAQRDAIRCLVWSKQSSSISHSERGCLPGKQHEDRRRQRAASISDQVRS